MPYAAPSFGHHERAAVQEILEDVILAPGNRVERFERAMCAVLGKPHAVMVNSGSSANLLALTKLLPAAPTGGEVITPALTFATTVAPIIQAGLRPVFVDVNAETLVVDVDDVKAAITDKTVALMIPLLLGSIPDMMALRELADEHGFTFISDECDTLGGSYYSSPPGIFSHISTTSFYATHIITAAGGGGMIATEYISDAEMARLRSCWGRASTLFGHGERSEDVDRRFADTYDAKFSFPAIGYNMQPLEVQAAFALEQLKRLGEFTLARRRNWRALHDRLDRISWIRTIPMNRSGVEPVWLAFPFFVRDARRQKLAIHLEERGIQTRPIMAGNILRQTGFDTLGDPSAFNVANRIMETGILVGCHQSLTTEQIDYVADTIEAFGG